MGVSLSNHKQCESPPFDKLRANGLWAPPITRRTGEAGVQLIELGFAEMGGFLPNSQNTGFRPPRNDEI